MFAMYDNRAVDSLIIDDDFNKERSCKNNSELQALMILFNIAILIAINVKIIFVESNDKDAYCAHKSFKDVNVFINIDAFMNMSQLKMTQIWDMRLNEYLKYWSLKALKSVTVTLYKLRMWWYIWNCHACQRSKVFKDSINELHHSFSISQKCWKDIIINFIIELFLSEDYNIICTIICYFIKECYYVFYHWEDDDISVEEMIWIMLWNVYQLHDLLSSIVSNKDFQFISTMWKSLCK